MNYPYAKDEWDCGIIRFQINASKDDETDGYEVIVELRCSPEITNGSFDGVVSILNHE